MQSTLPGEKHIWFITCWVYLLEFEWHKTPVIQECFPKTYTAENKFSTTRYIWENLLDAEKVSSKEGVLTQHAHFYNLKSSFHGLPSDDSQKVHISNNYVLNLLLLRVYFSVQP